jgi:hypothetical protein
LRRERKNVGRVVFAQKLAVPAAEVGIPRDEAVEAAAFRDAGVKTVRETLQFVAIEPGARWHAPESYQWVRGLDGRC